MPRGARHAGMASGGSTSPVAVAQASTGVFSWCIYLFIVNIHTPAVAVATVNATYRWVESEAKRVLREVLSVRERQRRQEVTPPVAQATRVRAEPSDDDDGAAGTGAGAAA